MKKRNIVDIHAHILPGVDDGAKNMRETCLLLQKAAEQGISAVIATPHNSTRIGTEQLRELTMQMEQEFGRQFPDFYLYTGQEIYFHEEMIGRLREGKLLTMADSRYVMVEFSPGVSYGSLHRGIRTLVSAGYWPVLAHVERYRCLRREENLRDLEESGCLFQMNYSSLTGGRFSGDVRWCRKQVLAGRIHFLGTDMHRMDFRPPEIDRAMEWLEKHVDEELLEEMIWGNPMHMIKKEGIL